MSSEPPPDLPTVARALRELPPPEAAAAAISDRLAEQIRVAIAEAPGRRIGFDRFMELALYAPGLGYYSAGSRKFGAEGDFVTAPEISPLFSRCLARQCAEVLDAGDSILEFGAGSGVMAVDLLTELETRGALPTGYFILEVSADLRERQAAALAERAPHLAARVQWLERWPERFSGVILANEVLDAMPVHRFRVAAGGIEELYVALECDRLVDAWGAPSSPRVAAELEVLRRTCVLAEGYASELNLAARDWTARIATLLERGAVFIIDYGFPRAELYHPQRAEGTLMCHYRHRAHQNPYFLPGLQDITTHVDFTAIAEAALAAGARVAGFANQANFLLGNGLAEMALADGPKAQLALSAEVKRLTLPGEMGELFKVLALTRGIERPLAGFRLRDERGRL